MQIRLTATLLHIYPVVNRDTGEQRIQAQFLEHQSLDQSVKLHSFKLPKGSAIDTFRKLINQTFDLDLKMWSNDGRSGFYIPDSYSINPTKETTKAI